MNATLTAAAQTALTTISHTGFNKLVNHAIDAARLATFEQELKAAIKNDDAAVTKFAICDAYHFLKSMCIMQQGYNSSLTRELEVAFYEVSELPTDAVQVSEQPASLQDQTATAYQFFTFAELAKKENKAHRLAFGLDTAAEVKNVAADLKYSDPDFLRMPGGRLVAFTEVGGIIATVEPLTGAQHIALTNFFAGKCTLVETSEELDSAKPSVKYRGGSGYHYSHYEINA